MSSLENGAAVFLFSDGTTIEKIYPQRIRGIQLDDGSLPISVSFGLMPRYLETSRVSTERYQEWKRQAKALCSEKNRSKPAPPPTLPPKPDHRDSKPIPEPGNDWRQPIALPVQRVSTDFAEAYAAVAPLVTESLAYFESGKRSKGLDALRRARELISVVGLFEVTLGAPNE